MLVRLLWVELGVELLLFTLLGIWLHQGLDHTLGWGLLTGLGLFLGLRVVLVGLMFAIAWVYRAARPAPMRLGPWRTLRMLVAELGAFVALYLVLHPFAPWLEKRVTDFSTPSAQPPVLLIHGLLCNPGYWWSLRRYLRKRGVTPVFTLTLEPLFADIDHYAEQVAGRIEQIHAATGAPRLILVGHSMGGLVACAYLRRHAERGRVAKIITLGSPHHGTRHARFFLPQGANIRQMGRNSPWLSALDTTARVGEHAAVPIVSIYSWHDNLVAPQDSAILDHAKNIPLAGVGHLTLGFSRSCQDLIHQEIVETAPTHKIEPTTKATTSA